MENLNPKPQDPYQSQEQPSLPMRLKVMDADHPTPVKENHFKVIYVAVAAILKEWTQAAKHYTILAVDRIKKSSLQIAAAFMAFARTERGKITLAAVGGAIVGGTAMYFVHPNTIHSGRIRVESPAVRTHSAKSKTAPATEKTSTPKKTSKTSKSKTR